MEVWKPDQLDLEQRVNELYSEYLKNEKSKKMCESAISKILNV